jgi:hypothetical protein
VRRRGDGQLKPGEPVDQAFDGAAGIDLAELLEALLELRDVLVGRGASGGPCGFASEQLPYVEGLDDADLLDLQQRLERGRSEVGAVAAHVGAAAVTHVDQAHDVQRPDRFADRRLADAEVLRELAFVGEPLACLQPVGHDVLAKRFDDLVGHLAAAAHGRGARRPRTVPPYRTSPSSRHIDQVTLGLRLVSPRRVFSAGAPREVLVRGRRGTEQHHMVNW